MKTNILFLLFMLVVLTSCLQRNNPLDPIGHSDIDTPETVSNITYTHSQAGALNKYVDLHWDANSPLTTDGYFVYRSLAYPSEYSVVDTVFTNACNHGSEPWHEVFGGITYWYKVSAFKDYSAGRLEGRLSEAVPVFVPI